MMRCEHEIDGDRCTKCGAIVLDDAGTTEEQRLDLHRWSRAMGVPSPIWRRSSEVPHDALSYAKIDYSDNGPVTKYATTPEEGEWPEWDAVLRIDGRNPAMFVPKPETTPSGEWPARDAVPRVTNTVVLHGAPIGVPEPEVTPEMVAAGKREAYGYPGGMIDVTGIYRAMAALAPVPLVSDGEAQAVRERDEAREELEGAYERLLRAPEGGISVAYHVAQIDALSDTIDNLRAIIEARDARIAELDTLLAQKSAPVVEAKSAVVIREHRSEPWRMGLA